MAVMLFWPPNRSAAADQIPDSDVWILAAASYYEIQTFLVNECDQRFAANLKQYQALFDQKYGNYFQSQRRLLGPVLEKINSSESAWKQGILVEPARGVTVYTCTEMLPKTLTARINDKEVVKSGLSNQFQFFRRELDLLTQPRNR